MASALPRNCTLGTKSFCLGYSDKITCIKLPFNVSKILSPTLPSSDYQPGDLQPLVQTIQKVSFVGIKSSLALGIVVIVAWLIMVQWAFWKTPHLLSRAFCGLPLEVILGSLLSSICIIFFVCPTIVLWVLYFKTQNLRLITSSKKGSLITHCVEILCCVALMTFCMALTFWRRYMRT